MRELYFDFGVHSVLAPRSINSVAERRGMARELLVVGWERPSDKTAGPGRTRRDAPRRKKAK
jgi:hypothetical protein